MSPQTFFYEIKMEINAYNKGLKIISSCINSTHIHIAYNYIHNYRLLFGKTRMWKDLYGYCSKRREIVNGIS